MAHVSTNILCFSEPLFFCGTTGAEHFDSVVNMRVHCFLKGSVQVPFDNFIHGFGEFHTIKDHMIVQFNMTLANIHIVCVVFSACRATQDSEFRFNPFEEIFETFGQMSCVFQLFVFLFGYGLNSTVVLNRKGSKFFGRRLRSFRIQGISHVQWSIFLKEQTLCADQVCFHLK